MSSFLVSAYTAGLRGWNTRRAKATLKYLRRTGQIVADPNLIGFPDLDVRGSMRMGVDVTIASEPVQTHFAVYYGGVLDIGDRVTIGHGSGIACYSQLTIGTDTTIGNYVLMLDSDYHVAGDPNAVPQISPIEIGSNVTIGDRTIILRGSRIEDHAIIDADSVVSGIISAGAHVGGVPARDQTRSEGPRAAGSSIESGVLTVAKKVFRLPNMPVLGDTSSSIPRWDSLGALSFLMALEETFGITLDVDQAGHVRSLSDVAGLVRVTLDARGVREAN